jgi:hypothetical protein
MEQRFRITDKKTGKFLASYPLSYSIDGAIAFFERAGYEVAWSWSKKPKREFMKRLMPGVYLGQNSGGWLMLIKLPLGYGLNLGPGFSGYWSIRSWSWSKYDFADHFSYRDYWRWMKYPEGGSK